MPIVFFQYFVFCVHNTFQLIQYPHMWCTYNSKHDYCYKKVDRMNYLRIEQGTLADVVWLVGASSSKLKGHRLDFQSGHIPRFQVWSIVREQVRGN